MEFKRTEHSFSKGDKTIYGELYMPAGISEKPPLVIASHGYNGCCEYMRQTMGMLAEKGIAVYCYDFCGGGTKSRSTGKSVEMTIPGEQQDLRDVIAHILGLGQFDEARVCLYGESMGGFVTALTAPDFAEIIKGLFLVFPAFCIPDDWRERKAENTDELIDFNGMTISKRFVEAVPDYDVFERAAEFKGRVHIFHGDSDKMVRLSYSERLKKAYNNADISVYPEQGHGFDEKYIAKMTETIAAEIL